MISQDTLQRLTREIHAIPELNSCVIGFQGNGQSRVLHSGRPFTPAFGRCCVVIEEVVTLDAALTSNTRRFAERATDVSPGDQAPAIVKNSSVVAEELFGAGLSCTFAAASVVGVFGSAAAEVPTLGGSTFLLVVSWGGMITSGVSCLNGVVRVGMAWSDPDGNSLQQLDDNALYTAANLINDGVGVALGVGGLAIAGKNLWAVLARQRAFTSRGLTFESLKAMNRTQRGQVIREAMEEASKTANGRKAIMDAAQNSKVGGSAAKNGGLSVRNADRMVKVISEETTRRLHSTAFGILTNLSALVISASPKRYVGGASGSINWIINIVDGSSE